MKSTRYFTMLLLLLALPLAGWAQSERLDQRNVPDPNVRTVSPGPEAAQVVGVLGKPNRELFGVRFVELNGRNIPPRDSMWLPPGSYVLKVVIDAAHVRRPPIYRSSARESAGQNEIRLELEAGKTYEIRARYQRDDRDTPYVVVVHRVREH